MEGQGVDDGLLQVSTRDAGDAAERAHMRPDHRQRKLAGKQLIVGEPLHIERMRLDVGSLLRHMQRAQAFSEIRPAGLVQMGFVQPLRQVRDFLQRRVNGLLQRLGGKARRQRVNRFEYRHRGGLFRLQRIVRVHHLGAIVEPVDLAGDDSPFPFRKRLLQPVPARMKEDEGDLPGLVMGRNPVGGPWSAGVEACASRW
ncbi:hypothetical protein QW131_09720 [Roseibium salinum]|nr:hypothetical protein [Roseibium salinum]